MTAPPPIRTLIIDDEPLARSALTLVLGRDSSIELVGESAGARGVDDILSLAPDLVFLDVQMPGCDGFEVLARIPRERLPLVVFVTAFDEYATRAFEEQALDYLLKPWTDERLAKVVERARLALVAREALAARREAVGRFVAEQVQSRLVVADGGRRLIFRLDEVIAVRSSGVYVEIRTRRGNHLVRETLSAVEARLPIDRFLRVHRTALVAVAQVVELRAATHGDASAVLRDGTTVPVSRARRAALDRALGIGP